MSQCHNVTNVLRILLKHPQQGKGWKRVSAFRHIRLLSAPKGHYVELNFTMRSYPWASRPCLRDYYLEIRDGNNHDTYHDPSAQDTDCNFEQNLQPVVPGGSTSVRYQLVATEKNVNYSCE
ncbi:hypothetical protein pdam_00020172, partial [Pocillopora damicornis]